MRITVFIDKLSSVDHLIFAMINKIYAAIKLNSPKNSYYYQAK